MSTPGTQMIRGLPVKNILQTVSVIALNKFLVTYNIDEMFTSDKLIDDCLAC